MRDQNSQHVLQRASLRKLLREQGNLLGEELDKMGWMVRYVVKSKLKLLKRQQVMLTQLRNIFIIKQDDASHRMMIFGLKIHSQDQITGMCITLESKLCVERWLCFVSSFRRLLLIMAMTQNNLESLP